MYKISQGQLKKNHVFLQATSLRFQKWLYIILVKEGKSTRVSSKYSALRVLLLREVDNAVPGKK